MLSKEQNERLTRVGPGTPGGELLRRYWQPLCVAAELTEAEPIKRVRILGEDLVVFRDPSNRFGCVDEICAHRRASLRYGFVEDGAIRCCYHGWKYDLQGRCVEQPFEPVSSNFRDKVTLQAYPVLKLAGILFAYMGPDPAKAPLLPRWDVLVREDGERMIRMFPEYHCNWLQVQENTADSVHTYYLHGHMSHLRNLPVPGVEFYRRPIVDYSWEECEWGIDKVIMYGGANPEKEIRPPLIFPNILRIPQPPVEALHWRVPIDDEHTRVIWIGFLPGSLGGKPMAEDADPPFDWIPNARNEKGEYDVSSVYNQDQMAFETQGVVLDRSKERLGVSDRGIIMFRKMLDEQIALVEQGREPTVAVVRDPARNRLIGFEGTTYEGSLEISMLK